MFLSVDLSFAAEVPGPPKNGYYAPNGGMMADWKDESFEKISSQLKKADLDNQVLVQAQNLLENESPGVWSSIATELNAYFQEANGRFGKAAFTFGLDASGSEPTYEATYHIGNKPRKATLKWHQKLKKMSLSVDGDPSTRDEFTFEVVENRVVIRDGHITPLEPVGVVKRLVQRLTTF